MAKRQFERMLQSSGVITAVVIGILHGFSPLCGEGALADSFKPGVQSGESLRVDPIITGLRARMDRSPGAPENMRSADDPAPPHDPHVAENLTVTGDIKNMELRTDGAPIRKILEALQDKYPIEIMGGQNLSEACTGVYQGSLEQVISRLLQKADFLVTRNGERFVVRIYATGATVANNSVLPKAEKDSGRHSKEKLATRLFGEEAPPPIIDNRYLQVYYNRVGRAQARRDAVRQAIQAVPH
jgi:hypothetical protein